MTVFSPFQDERQEVLKGALTMLLEFIYVLEACSWSVCETIPKNINLYSEMD